MVLLIFQVAVAWYSLSIAGAVQVGGPLPEEAVFLEEVRKRLASDEAL